MAEEVELSRFRSGIIEQYRKYRAILVLTNQLSASVRMEIDEELRRLPNLRRQELRQHMSKIKKNLKKESQKFGVKASLKEMEQAINSSPPPSAHDTGFHLRVGRLNQMFEHYDKVIPDYKKFPPHAIISVDAHGTQQERKASWYIHEQIFFIGMAMHWNDSYDAWRHSEYSAGRIGFALLHSTIRAAFALMEVYINNLAHNTYITNPDINKNDRDILREWNSDLSRPQYVRFKKKLLSYPRIALGLDHPILGENNCPELKAILEFNEQYRHAVTHPTFRLTPAQLQDKLPSREHVLWNLDIDITRDICDSIVDLIFKIDDALDGMFGTVEIWLHRRGKDGYFPKDKLK